MLNLSRLSSEDSDHLTFSEVAQEGGTPGWGAGGCAANASDNPRKAEVSGGEQHQRKSRQTAVDHSIDNRWNRLMAAAQRGDEAAYERLMREVRVWLSRYFHRRLPAAAADDATQEALLAVHLHKQSYQTSDPMRPWLKTIARFKWIDQLRSHVRSPESLEDMEVPVEDHGSATRAAILLDLLLADTKPAQEMVIRLVKLRGASVEEASRISGQSPSLVKVNIHRGLKRIGRALDSSED
jgi:RNA polymerase sigma-70 factor (ECF subfamily)